MAAVHVTVWDDRDRVGGGGAPTASGAPAAAAAPALFIHNIFTWGSDPTYGFAGQRPSRTAGGSS